VNENHLVQDAPDDALGGPLGRAGKLGISALFMRAIFAACEIRYQCLTMAKLETLSYRVRWKPEAQNIVDPVYFQAAVSSV